MHSVIIGISLGASESPKTIKPQVVALSFHQFFEGMGLGGCISQVSSSSPFVHTIVLFFFFVNYIKYIMVTEQSRKNTKKNKKSICYCKIINSETKRMERK